MELSVRINDVHGSQMAAKITGAFRVDGSDEFRFSAIAFGRIGGQNVGAKLSKATRSALEGLGHDPEEVLMALQKSLLEGRLRLPEGLKRESFAD